MIGCFAAADSRKSLEEILAHCPARSRRVFLFDDSKEMRRAHQVGEIAAPGRVDPAGQAETHCLSPHRAAGRPSRRRPAPFSKGQQIGHNIEMFAAPVPAGRAHAALHFVEDEKHFVLVANPAQAFCSHSPRK